MKKIFKQTLHIPLLVCGACLWGCTGAGDSGAKDASDSLTEASAIIDTAEDASAIADTITVDSIDRENEASSQPPAYHGNGDNHNHMASHN